MPASEHKPHHPAPEAVDLRSPRAGLQTIATIEAIKGAFVLAAGFGLLALVHKDLPEVADHLIHRIHLNPEGHLSHLFLRLADRGSDGKLWAVAGGAFAYSVVRFVEAYGLWNARVWAEWFAILSGCLYLPWEIYEVFAHRHWFRVLILVFNVLVVLYLIYARVRALREGSDGPEELPPPVAVHRADVDPRMLE